MWGVLCAGLINSLRRVLGLEDRHAVWEEKSERGSSGPRLQEAKAGVSGLGHGGNDMQIRIHRDQAIKRSTMPPCEERRPSQVAPASSKWLPILVPWMEPWPGGQGAGVYPPACHTCTPMKKICTFPFLDFNFPINAGW